MSAAESIVDLVAPPAGPVAKVHGEPMLEMPHDLYIPPEALEVFLETFEGPLDLLPVSYTHLTLPTKRIV